MLMSPRVPTRELFDGLRLVIIDEIHAFAGDDRGAHLVSLLERLSPYCGKAVQCVGLSATVGNPEEILRWVQGSSERESTIVNPGGSASSRSSPSIFRRMPTSFGAEHNVHGRCATLTLVS